MMAPTSPILELPTATPPSPAVSLKAPPSPAVSLKASPSPAVSMMAPTSPILELPPAVDSEGLSCFAGLGPSYTLSSGPTHRRAYSADFTEPSRRTLSPRRSGDLSEALRFSCSSLPEVSSERQAPAYVSPISMSPHLGFSAPPSMDVSGLVGYGGSRMDIPERPTNSAEAGVLSVLRAQVEQLARDLAQKSGTRGSISPRSRPKFSAAVAEMHGNEADEDVQLEDTPGGLARHRTRAADVRATDG